MSDSNSGASGYAHGNRWQYHPRSDRHSKVACWAVLFDLARAHGLLAAHVRDGKVAFGINHTMRDYRLDRAKDLDLVVCRRAALASGGVTSFAQMVPAYGIVLDEAQAKELAALPEIPITGVQTTLVALEAKAAFTEFGKARPRLYDELNSSHLTIHGDTDSAIAAGLALVNAAPSFVSPLRNPWALGSMPTKVTTHRQPRDVEVTLAKLHQLPRRSAIGQPGFDALGVVVVECRNDGSAVTSISGPPAPEPGDALHYDTFIERLTTIYSTRYGSL
jgi:hypothetical protein